MAASFERTFIQDLNERLDVHYRPEIVFSNNNMSNVIHVRLYRGTAAYSEGGTVSATCIRSDGKTVPILNGTISGNVVTVSLIKACMVIPGPIQVFINLSSGDVNTTIFKGVFSAEPSETDAVIDPGDVISGISDLINTIEETRESIPANYSQLLASIAGTYSTSATYTVGSYVWYGGKLYRCILPITTPEAWTARKWSEVVLGDETAHIIDAVTADNYALNVGRLLFPGMFEIGTISNSGANIASTDRVRSTETVYFDKDIEYTIASGYKVKPIKWDSSDTLQPSTAYYTGTYTFSAGYKYKVVICRDPETGTAVTDVNEFANALYRPFTDSTFLNDTMPANAKAVGDAFAGMREDVFFHPYGLLPYQMSLFKPSANLFSDFCYHTTDAYYRARLAGDESYYPRNSRGVNWQGWLLRVKPNTSYAMGPLDFRLEFCKRDGTLDLRISEFSETAPNIVTSGPESYWLCLTQKLSRDMSDWMLVEGTEYPSAYVSGYPQWLAEPLSPDAGRNKTIAFMGDSITAGVGVASAKAYHMFIHDMYGFTCLNYGYGGAGYYQNFTGTSSGRIGQGVPGIGVATSPETAFTPNNVIARLPELDASVIDGIVIFAGTNDWGNHVSIENFISGIESAFEYCKTNYTKCPVLVMLPVHRGGDTEPNRQGKTLREYCDIIVQECEKYGIAYIDTMTMSGMYPDNAENKAYYFSDSVGLHPNVEGHKRLATVIGSTLKALVGYTDLT